MDWDKLKEGGNVVLIRHALTEGGDGHIVVDEGLSPEGRAQAELLIPAFEDISIKQVLSSPLRRCKETAELMFGGSDTWWALTTLTGFDGRERYERTKVVLDHIVPYLGNGNLILMTHRRNIFWLTDEVVNPGGIILFSGLGS